MTLRVGVVISSEHSGGGEQYLLRLYAGLSERHDAEPHLLGRLDGWDELGLASTDVGLGAKWSFRTLRTVITSIVPERRAALQRIRDEHERRPFDVFHLQYKREQLLLTRSLSKLAPVVWTEHGRLPSGRKGAVVGPAYRWAARRVASVIGVSDAVVGDVRRVCGDDVETVVFPTAADERIFRPPADEAERRRLREEFDIPDGDIVASVVARLHPDKRVERALGLVAPGDGVTLLVAGDGPEAARLEALGRDLPVRFLGWTDVSSRVHRVSDVSVQPFSVQGEGSPNTSVIEAAMSGCALVGFDDDPPAADLVRFGGVVLRSGQTLVDSGVIETIEERRTQSLEWSRRHRLGPWLDAHLDVLSAAASADSSAPSP